MLSIRLDPDTEKRLAALAEKTGRTKSYYAREALLEHRIELKELNWIGGPDLTKAREHGLPVWARVRSTRPPVAARLFTTDAGPHVVLQDGEMGVAPGQAVVCYDGERVLGGGWID